MFIRNANSWAWPKTRNSTCTHTSLWALLPYCDTYTHKSLGFIALLWYRRLCWSLSVFKRSSSTEKSAIWDTMVSKSCCKITKDYSVKYWAKLIFITLVMFFIWHYCVSLHYWKSWINSEWKWTNLKPKYIKLTGNLWLNPFILMMNPWLLAWR